MRLLGILVNVAMRAAISRVHLDALLHGDAPRYRGKALGSRGFVILACTLVVPFLHARRQRDGDVRSYPFWVDNLWLSIFALDQLGNYYDLYDRYRFFDAIPHTHGTGAGTVAIAELFDLPPLSAVGVAQLGHIGLEVQEYWSDVLFDLRNVRGTWDMANDLSAGAIGSTVYAAILARVRRGREERARRATPARG